MAKSEKIKFEKRLKKANIVRITFKQNNPSEGFEFLILDSDFYKLYKYSSVVAPSTINYIENEKNERDKDHPIVIRNNSPKERRLADKLIELSGYLSKNLEICARTQDNQSIKTIYPSGIKVFYEMEYNELNKITLEEELSNFNGPKKSLKDVKIRDKNLTNSSIEDMLNKERLN